MSAYTVTQLVDTKTWEGQHGPMVTYSLDVSDPSGKATRVQMNQKPTSPAPAVGQIIEGTLEPNGSFPMKLKKAPPAFGGGGGSRPMDPKVQAQIIRQHSQGCALKYAALRHAQGKLPDDFSLEDLWKIAEAFDRDAKAAGDRA